MNKCSNKKNVAPAKKPSKRKKNTPDCKVALSCGSIRHMFLLHKKKIAKNLLSEYLLNKYKHTAWNHAKLKFVATGADFLVIPDNVDAPSMAAIKANPEAEIMNLKQFVHDICDGCFGGNSEVLVLREGLKRVCDVIPGDFVQVYGGFSKVLIAVKINIQSDVLRLENGLRITKTHPIRVHGQWIKPKRLPFARETANCLYNFVLQTSHIMIINGTECITWGHDNPEVFHPFYGSSERISAELSSLKKEGEHVIVNGFMRDREQHVIGFF